MKINQERIEEIQSQIESLYEEKNAIERRMEAENCKEFIEFISKNGMIYVDSYYFRLRFDESSSGTDFYKTLGGGMSNHFSVNLSESIECRYDDGSWTLDYIPVKITKESCETVNRFEELFKWLKSINFNFSNLSFFQYQKEVETKKRDYELIQFEYDSVVEIFEKISK